MLDITTGGTVAIAILLARMLEAALMRILSQSTEHTSQEKIAAIEADLNALKQSLERTITRVEKACDEIAHIKGKLEK